MVVSETLHPVPSRDEALFEVKSAQSERIAAILGSRKLPDTSHSITYDPGGKHEVTLKIDALVKMAERQKKEMFGLGATPAEMIEIFHSASKKIDGVEFSDPILDPPSET